MPRIITAWFVVALVAPTLMLGQYGYGRRRYPTATATPGLDVPAATFQGSLRSLNKKELRIDVVGADEESLTFRVSKKTHFLKDGKEIKRSEVPVGIIVAVDATRDPDQKFSALSVVVSPPKPKTADQ